MFSYIMLGTNDLPRASTFYDPLMEMLRYPRGGRNEDVAWWGVFNGNNTTALGVGRPFDKQDATTGNGVMVTLIARSAEHIQQLHALALNHGGNERQKKAAFAAFRQEKVRSRSTHAQYDLSIFCGVRWQKIAFGLR